MKGTSTPNYKLVSARPSYKNLISLDALSPINTMDQPKNKVDSTPVKRRSSHDQSEDEDNQNENKNSEDESDDYEEANNTKDEDNSDTSEEEVNLRERSPKNECNDESQKHGSRSPAKQRCAFSNKVKRSGLLYTPESRPPIRGNQVKTDSSSLLYVTLLILACGIILLYFVKSDDALSGKYSKEDFEKDFHNQHEDLWIYVESGVTDIINIGRPAVLILAYKSDAEETTNNIWEKMARYISYELNAKHEPVVIEGSTLGKQEYMTDYGKILTDYKSNLEESKVMVVKNLEKVPGYTAQAFHAICDQYDGLVKNSFIIFTMKLERDLPADYYNYIEQKLRVLWSDIEDDKFYPLFTRLSNIIVQIFPEDK